MGSSVSGRTSDNAGDFPHFPLVRYPSANWRTDLSFFLGVGVPEMRTNLLKDRRVCIICVRPSGRLWTVGPPLPCSPVILTVTAEKPSCPRYALGDSGDVLRADALSLGVDLAQHDQHLLGDDVARDALAFGLELVHVDPHGIKRRCSRGDDACMQQSFDQDAEDVGAVLQLLAAVVVAEALLHRVAHPLPVEAILGVDHLFLL